jgi:3-oxoacyl-[acyl-carrier protein] reductase
VNKVVVITGASKGIGAATAIAFGKVGYDVVLNYYSDDKAAKEVAKTIEAAGQKVASVQADIFTETGIATLLAAVKDKFGKIDVLVNNAGLAKEPEFGQWTQESIDKSLTGNVVSAMLCTQAFVPFINKGGCILFTSSIYGLNFGGNPNLALYSAGKAALINFSQTMAEKLAPNIRCNVVVPGTTKTPVWDGANPAYAQKSLDMTLQKEWVAAEEIANTFVFLASTSHITAQTIVVDAGWQKKIRDNSPARESR